MIGGIDIRPATGQLYAVGGRGFLYTIDPLTGVANTVGSGFGSGFGFGGEPDFNPTNDLIRVVDGARNFRVNPNTGAIVDSDPGTPGVQLDGNLQFDPVTGLSGATPAVRGAAYNNNDNDPSTGTTLHVIVSSRTGRSSKIPRTPGRWSIRQGERPRRHSASIWAPRRSASTSRGPPERLTWPGTTNSTR